MGAAERIRIGPTPLERSATKVMPPCALRESRLGGATPRDSDGAPGPTACPAVGHAPQRSARSTPIGPRHPHLRCTVRSVFDAALVGPDGTLYTWQAHSLSAFRPTVHHFAL